MRKIIYDQEHQLSFWYYPSEQPTDRLIALFHGGGWKGGTPDQFVPFAQEFAKIGYHSALFEYRVANRFPGTMARDCFEDCRRGIRCLIERADELNFDPNHMIVGGGSAGGHLALCLSMLERNINFAGLLLFNPVVDLSPDTGTQSQSFDERWRELSPMQLLKKALPPVFIVHGKEDDCVTWKNMTDFVQKIEKMGGQVELYGFLGEGHGFFNYGNPAYEKVLEKTLDFLKRFPEKTLSRIEDVSL